MKNRYSKKWVVEYKAYSPYCATVHQKGEKQLFLCKEEGKEHLVGFPGGMYGIQLCKAGKVKFWEIGIGTIHKNSPVINLGLVELPWSEFHFPLKINISGRK